MSRDHFQADADAVIAFIVKTNTERGYPPSIEEIANEMGYASRGGCYRLIKRMQDAGLITSDPRTARSIRVVMKTETEPL